MQALLETGLKGLGLEPEPSLCKAYLTYIELLAKWNKTYNLTAIKEPEAMLSRHVFDSLSVHTFIEGKRCLDIGTGAGLPGLMLALAQPEKHWTLLDSNQKKTRFLQHVKTQLNICNIDIIHSRSNVYQDEQGFDTIICRAFSSLCDFYSASHHLLKDAGKFLAMKADIKDAELKEVDSLIRHMDVKELNVPGETSRRCLVIMTD